MGKKSPPSPPDPVATANAQAQANIDAATANAWLNNANRVGPEGSVTYNQTGTQTVGIGNEQREIPTFSITTQLSPQEQANYDIANQFEFGAMDTARSLLANAAPALTQPFQIPQSPQQVQGVDVGPINTSFNPGGAIAPSFDTGDPLQTTFNAGPALRTSIGTAGEGIATQAQGAGQGVQTGLDTTGLPGMPGLEDFTQDRERYFDALMGRQTGDMERERAALEQRLANQGIAYGTQAWNDAMDDLNRRRTDAVNAAYLASGDEQARMFGMASQARQQQFGEELAGGQFANSAQQQQWNQLLQSLGFQNSAQAQAWAQQAQEAEFGNQAAGQQFDINRALAEFYNTAQGQGFDQAQAEAAFYNQAQNQAFAQNQAQAVFGNQAQGQLFGQGQANAALQNAARAQAIQEGILPQTQAANMVATLFGLGGSVPMPQFQQYASPIAPGDVQGNTYASYNGQLNAWNQQNANRNALIGALSGTAGTIGGAGILRGWF